MQTARIEQWLGCTVAAITPLTGGWEADVDRIDTHEGVRFVLRRHSGRFAGAKATREAAALTGAERCGFAAPRLITADPSGDVIGSPSTVMTFHAGQAVGTDLTPGRLTRLGALQARLHALDTSAFGGAPVSPIAEVDAWASIAAEHPVVGLDAALEVVRGRLAAIRPRRAVIHWDFHAFNVIEEPSGTWTTIDWTQTAVGDPRFDVAWTVMLTARGDPHIEETLLEGYRANGGSLDGLERFAAAAMLKRVASIAIALTHGPEAIGMRPEAATEMGRDRTELMRVYERFVDLAGVRVEGFRRIMDG